MKIILKSVSLMGIIAIASGILLQSTFATISTDNNKIKALNEIGLTKSSPYLSSTDCNSDVEKYNTEFPNYKRTLCLKNTDGNYYYFLYTSSNATEVENILNTVSSTTSNLITTTSTSSNSSDEVSYINSLKSKLSNKSAENVDKLLTSLKNKQASKTKEEYITYVDKLLTQLDKLKTKYANNLKVSDLINYLKVSIIKIKLEYTDNSDEDSFWEELGLDNTGKIICPSVANMPPIDNFCKKGEKIVTTKITDNNGCTNYKYSCAPIVCRTTEGLPPSDYCKTGTKLNVNKYIDNDGCENYKYSCEPIICPEYQIAGPDFCVGGKIIPGGKSSDGCQLPPTCEMPKISCGELNGKILTGTISTNSKGLCGTGYVDNFYTGTSMYSWSCNSSKTDYVKCSANISLFKCVASGSPDPLNFCKAGEKMISTKYTDNNGCENYKYSCEAKLKY